MKVYIKSAHSYDNLHNLTKQDMLDIVNGPDINARYYLAEETKDQEILSMLADDEDRGVRWNVLRHAKDPEIFLKFVDDEDIFTRQIAAECASDKYPEVVYAFAQDPNYLVRMNILERIRHPKKYKDLLWEMSDDEHSHVRGMVADFCKDEDILAKLSDDPDGFVRFKVADNTTDVDLLNKLADDTDAGNIARKRLKDMRKL